MSGIGEYIFQIAWLILIFSLVIFLAYFVTKFVSLKAINYSKSNNLEIIDRIAIGRDKYLYIIKAGNKYILIGTSGNYISRLKDLKEEELNITKKNKIDFANNLNITIKKLRELKEFRNRYLEKKDGELK